MWNPGEANLYTIEITNTLSEKYTKELTEILDETTRDFLFESGLYEHCTKIVYSVLDMPIEAHAKDENPGWNDRENMILDLCWEVMNSCIRKWHNE